MDYQKAPQAQVMGVIKPGLPHKVTIRKLFMIEYDFSRFLFILLRYDDFLLDVFF